LESVFQQELATKKWWACEGKIDPPARRTGATTWNLNIEGYLPRSYDATHIGGQAWPGLASQRWLTLVGVISDEFCD
jgi:hypothetical protein